MSYTKASHRNVYIYIFIVYTSVACDFLHDSMIMKGNHRFKVVA